MSDDALHNLVSRLVDAGGDIGEDDEDGDYHEVVQVRGRHRMIEAARARIRYDSNTEMVRIVKKWSKRGIRYDTPVFWLISRGASRFPFTTNNYLVVVIHNWRSRLSDF